ncbi:toprim domain-containing protein [Bacillus sp. FJAT-27445]|uniref:toprim domain-containing protein n=1 Tax=Bacillus sp. FJAT-27445 TaxID=1679166 RepID=UPI0007438F87|nr:toprim domain-containing protein [Bacillus sp. FJAT-27445]
MSEEFADKIIIVEGRSDKMKVLGMIKDHVEVICTNGTISLSKLDELIDSFGDRQVYILADADEAGEKLRRQFRREYPEAEHLYIDKMYKEVATAPYHHLAMVLLGANIDVHAEFLDMGRTAQ